MRSVDRVRAGWPRKADIAKIVRDVFRNAMALIGLEPAWITQMPGNGLQEHVPDGVGSLRSGRSQRLDQSAWYI